MKPFIDTSTSANLGASSVNWGGSQTFFPSTGITQWIIEKPLNEELRTLIKEVMESKTIKIETENDIFVFKVEDLRMWEANKLELEISIALNITSDEDDEKSFTVLEIDFEDKGAFDKIIKELDKVF